MRITSIRVGLVITTLNVLIFIVMLLTRETAYDRLAELDACFRSGSSCDWSSAEPMYLAGRPFYSPAHVAGVPLAETLFFIVNLPAMLGAFVVQDWVADLRYWLEMEGLSLTQNSWLMASSFIMLAALWAFLLGAGSHRLARWVRTRRLQTT